MLLEQALITKLKTVSALTTLVSTRIYPGKAPQDVAAPYVVLNRISTNALYAHDGASGLVTARMQLSCFSSTYTEAKNIVEAIRGGLEAISGTMSSGPYIGHCFRVGETDLPYDMDLRLFGIAVDYEIQHNE